MFHKMHLSQKEQPAINNPYMLIFSSDLGLKDYRYPKVIKWNHHFLVRY